MYNAKAVHIPVKAAKLFTNPLCEVVPFADAKARETGIPAKKAPSRRNRHKSETKRLKLERVKVAVHGHTAPLDHSTTSLSLEITFDDMAMITEARAKAQKAIDRRNSREYKQAQKELAQQRQAKDKGAV